MKVQSYLKKNFLQTFMGSNFHGIQLSRYPPTLTGSSNSHGILQLSRYPPTLTVSSFSPQLSRYPQTFLLKIGVFPKNTQLSWYPQTFLLKIGVYPKNKELLKKVRNIQTYENII